MDFQRDIRPGDGFEVMFERLYDKHGNHVHSGNIRFATLTLSGKRHAIYRHTTRDGTDDLIVVDVRTENLLDRVDTGSRVANGKFRTAGGNRDVFYCTTLCMARVTWR